MKTWKSFCKFCDASSFTLTLCCVIIGIGFFPALFIWSTVARHYDVVVDIKCWGFLASMVAAGMILIAFATLMEQFEKRGKVSYVAGRIAIN
jgi:hypothetical protein